MRQVAYYKKNKKRSIELTSLLDLLFVMIFVSLLQQKEIVPAKTETKEPEKIVYDISATFNFYPTEHNRGAAKGSFIMSGKFDRKKRTLSLGGVGWIDRPKDYEMVPLSGTLDESLNVFTGRIEAIDCKSFTLKREAKRETTPISGEWRGTYDCAQGMTGLTLSIE